jgi:hypothetical protein
MISGGRRGSPYVNPALKSCKAGQDVVSQPVERRLQPDWCKDQTSRHTGRANAEED